MRMKKTLLAFAVLVAIALLSIPFVGWQTRWHRDANESPIEMWEPFIKQRMTFRMLYFDPLDCGACEERGIEDLKAEDRLELMAVCHDRYGLTSIVDCAHRPK